MIKPFTLQPLVNLAQKNNSEATRRFGQLNQQQQAAQDKLQSLQQYRKDYQQRFQESVRSGMDPIEMRNFQDFIKRLDTAIEAQKRVVEQSQSMLQAGRTELQDAQRKMKSFETLAQRHADNVKKLEAKAEQKTMDEFSGRKSTFNAGDHPKDAS
jgi:flagellar FliJ protein